MKCKRRASRKRDPKQSTLRLRPGFFRYFLLARFYTIPTHAEGGQKLSMDREAVDATAECGCHDKSEAVCETDSPVSQHIFAEINENLERIVLNRSTRNQTPSRNLPPHLRRPKIARSSFPNRSPLSDQENIDEQVQDLVHQAGDGGRPRGTRWNHSPPRDRPDDDQTDMLDRIESEFEDAFGEHADDRLAEVDHRLGAKTSNRRGVPNLRTFIEGDLFDYHVSGCRPHAHHLATHHRAPHHRLRGRGLRLSGRLPPASIPVCSTVSRTSTSNHGRPLLRWNDAVPRTVAGVTTRCRRRPRKPPLNDYETGVKADSNRSRLRGRDTRNSVVPTSGTSTTMIARVDELARRPPPPTRSWTRWRNDKREVDVRLSSRTKFWPQ